MTLFLANTIAASRSATSGKTIETLELEYPRIIHSEFLTHRKFSRNASSSRAVPVVRMLEKVLTNPFVPIHWGRSQPGMRADEETDSLIHLPGKDPMDREEAWLYGRDCMLTLANAYANAGYHKQVVNRLLEPFSHIRVLVTSTEWENFLYQRDDEDAEPHMRALAKAIRRALSEAKHVELVYGRWHLPYVTEEDWDRISRYCGYSLMSTQLVACKISAARCARVSYWTHDQRVPDIERDMKLYDRLAKSTPPHLSPLEHQATPDLPVGDGWLNEPLHGNFTGFCQYRKLLERGTAV